MFENPTLMEKLLFSTFKITCDNTNTGTGFFFRFDVGDERKVVVAVTNKHVVQGASLGEFVLTKRSSDGKPLVGQSIPVQITEFSRSWVPHPDPDVDLCIMPVGAILERADKLGGCYLRFLDMTLIPTQQHLNELDAIEDVLMIGYPIGLWDSVNNMPVVRRGITATHPAIDFEGKPIELLDIACFPGSSGSPVLLTTGNMRANRDGGMRIGQSQLLLLGIVYGVYQHTAQGLLQAINVPTALTPAPIYTGIPANLAIMVKSSKLLDFIPSIQSALAGHS